MSSSEARPEAEAIPSDPEVEESEPESEEDRDLEQEADSEHDDEASPGRWEGSDVSAEEDRMVLIVVRNTFGSGELGFIAKKLFI